MLSHTKKFIINGKILGVLRTLVITQVKNIT